MNEGSGTTVAPSLVAGGELVPDGGSEVLNGGGHIVPKGSSASWLRRCFTLKPLEVVHAEEEEGVLERTLGFWDLFALGFGGTVGSGVFVMTGLICHELAGPAGVFSWIIAGFGCLLSGLSFAELSWRVPSAGGAYAYAFVALGELPAAIVGWCMTLEYGISAAAVAKSWGEMLTVGLAHSSEDGSEKERAYMAEGLAFMGGVLDMGAVYAVILQAACVLIVVGGLKASTITVNTFCVAKGLLVLFMTATAFSLYDSDNLVPLAPFGARGVLKGSVAAFFGFLGFDEVVLLAPEAKNPAKHVPRALFASLVAVTAVCAAASVSLSGALPASELDPDSAFAEAFRDKGLRTAYKITAIGQLVTLPLVVLVSFMAQPRLLFAMAKDGLLPRVFSEVDSRGTLLKGSLLSGVVCTVTAALVPFDALDDIISAGVLLAFNFVTSSLLVLRYRDEQKGRDGIGRVFVANMAACASAGASIPAGFDGVVPVLLVIVSVACGAVGLVAVSRLQSRAKHAQESSGGNFLVPLFPWPQAAALWVNWFLVCQLSKSGLLSLAAYVTFGTIHYTCYGATHSVGNCSGWSSLLAAAAAGGRPGTMPGSPGLSLSIDAFADPLAGGSPVSPDGRPTAPLLGRSGVSSGGSDTDVMPPMAAREDGGVTGDVSAATMISPIHNQTPSVPPNDNALLRRRSAEGMR